MPRFTQLEPKPTAYEAPKAFGRPYYERQQGTNTGSSEMQAGVSRWAQPVRPPTLGPVVPTSRLPASPMGVKQRQRPTSAGPAPRSARRLHTALALGGQQAAPEMQPSRRHPPMMAIGTSPQRMAELEQQNELLHAAYGGARAQYETALKAVRSAAAASREHAEKLQKAEDRAARAERLIQALTAALVRSEKDALIVASELCAADEALASRARPVDVNSRDAVIAALQVIAEALQTPVAIRGSQNAIGELPYGQGIGRAHSSLKGAVSSDMPAESSQGVGPDNTCMDSVPGLQQARTEPPAAESAPEKLLAVDVATGAATVPSAPGAVEALDAERGAKPTAGAAEEAPELSMDAGALSKALAKQVVASAIMSAWSRVRFALQEEQHEMAAPGGDAMRADENPAIGAEEGVVATAAD